MYHELEVIELPKSFVEWQFSERKENAEKFGGMPSLAVAPIILTLPENQEENFTTEPKVIGMTAKREFLEEYTEKFKNIYERNVADGKGKVSKEALNFLADYYSNSENLNLTCFSSLEVATSQTMKNLEKNPFCTLLFYNFALRRGQFRIFKVESFAQIVDKNDPFFDYVYHRNSLFHGRAEKCKVLRFNVLSVTETKARM